MMTIQNIIEINKEFDQGKIVNQGSLDFALSYAQHSKDWLKQLAYIVRALCLDHIFEDGNKRTASALIMAILENQKLAYDPRKVDGIVIKIILDNTQGIDKIKKVIKNALR